MTPVSGLLDPTGVSRGDGGVSITKSIYTHTLKNGENLVVSSNPTREICQVDRERVRNKVDPQ